MTVADQTALNRHVGNGVTTVFPYQFKTPLSGDIAVAIDGDLQTLNVDYTLSGVGDAGGGNVTFLAAPAAAAIVVIYRDVDFARATDYQTGGDFLANPNVNGDFDRLWIALQQLRDVIVTRAIRAPIGESPAELPAAAARANMAAVFDADGDLVPAILTSSALTQSGFDAFLATAVQFLNSTALRHLRAPFALPATVRFFGDSFFEQPNAHTSSGDSMAQKAAVLLGVTPSISAASGNTAADRQDAMFAITPAATDLSVVGLGQNDAQFIGTSTDVEMRHNDVACIHLANLLHLAVPSGARRYPASGMTQSGGSAWTADSEVAEGGALKSNTITDTLAQIVTDARYVVVIYKVKNASGGKFSVVIDGTTRNGSVDSVGYHSAPFVAIPTNGGKTFARYALVFDLGRRKPSTTVQIVVSSTTNVANVVSICSVMGLSGDALSGPMLAACDLTDRGAAGYATAAGSQAAVQVIARIINHAVGVAGACGLRVVPVPISTVVAPAADLAADEFHPDESGAVAAAAAIADAIEESARDWSLKRPDLDAQSLVNGAAGYVLLAGMATQIGSDFAPKRALLSPRQINWAANDVVPTPDSIRIVFKDGSGAYNPAHALFLSREAAEAGVAYTGNLGATGDYALVAHGTSRVRLSNNTMRPVTDNEVSLGGGSFRYTTMALAPRTVANLPSAASNVGGKAIVSDANATTFNSVVAGGGANIVPVFSDGTNWRIG